MSGASTEEKVNIFFKGFNNVVNVVERTPFSNPINRYPKQQQFFVGDIFDGTIPDNLNGVQYTIGTQPNTITLTGTTALHREATDNNEVYQRKFDSTTLLSAPPTSLVNTYSTVAAMKGLSGGGSNLDFYYRIPLKRANTTPPLNFGGQQKYQTIDNRTWYLPDINDETKSFLKDAIAWNYHSGGTYIPILEAALPNGDATNSPIPYYQAQGGGVYWLFDNESGFIQLFGGDQQLDNLISSSSLNPPGPLFLSFIKYTGPKVVPGGSGSGDNVDAIDASFQNLYAQDASFQNVYVEDDIRFDSSIIGPDASFNHLYAEDASFQSIYVEGDMTIDGSIIGPDASFDHISCITLDCTSDASFQNVYVADSARLPEDTLVNPFHQKISSGSYNNNEQFFKPEYVETKQIKTIAVDPSLNPISTTDWITIARCTELFNTNKQGRLDCRADAMIKISQPVSGRHETITFIATFKYSEGLSINVLQHDWYSGPNIAALRIAYDDSPAPSGGSKESTYNGAVLQMQMSNNLRGGKFAAILSIQIMNNEDYPGWSQFTDSSGNYSNTERANLNSLNIPVAVPDNNPKSQRIDSSNQFAI